LVLKPDQFPGVCAVVVDSDTTAPAVESAAPEFDQMLWTPPEKWIKIPRAISEIKAINKQYSDRSCPLSSRSRKSFIALRLKL